MVRYLLRDRPGVAELSEALLPLSAQQDFPFWSAIATTFKGWALAHGPELECGVDQMRQGLTAYQATAAEVWVPYFLGLLAEARRELGQPGEGLDLLSEALERVERTNERWFEAELHRLRGALLLTLCERDRSGGLLPPRYRVARDQEAKFWELRAATDLARLWRDQGRRAEAHDLLAPVYGWFSEGFATPDLRDARALLDELG